MLGDKSMNKTDIVPVFTVYQRDRHHLNHYTNNHLFTFVAKVTKGKHSIQ